MKQFVQQQNCLQCRICCRFSHRDDIWQPHLLKEEKKLSLKILRHPQGEGFVCSHLDLENNRCRIYSRRPFECQFYPFLLNKQQQRVFISLDLSCPFVSDKTQNREFKEYLLYLVDLLKEPAFLAKLRTNFEIFSSYKTSNILNLVRLL
jgi:hypothetical protein